MVSSNSQQISFQEAVICAKYRTAKLAFTCSELKIKTLEQHVEYIQS